MKHIWLECLRFEQCDVDLGLRTLFRLRLIYVLCYLRAIAYQQIVWKLECAFFAIENLGFTNLLIYLHAHSVSVLFANSYLNL